MPKWRMMIFALDVWVKKSWPLPPKQENFVNFMKPKMAPDWRLFREFLFSRNQLFSQRNLGKKTKIIELGRKLFHTKHQKASERKSTAYLRLFDCSQQHVSNCKALTIFERGSDTELAALYHNYIWRWPECIIPFLQHNISVWRFVRPIAMQAPCWASNISILLISLINGISPSTLQLTKKWNIKYH